MKEKVSQRIRSFTPVAPEKKEWKRCGFEPQACAQIKILSEFASHRGVQQNREATDLLRRRIEAVQKRCHTYNGLNAVPVRYQHVDKINALPCDQLRDVVTQRLGISFEDSMVFGKGASHDNVR